MNAITTIKIHSKHADKYKKGYPLLFKEAIIGNFIFDAPDFEEGALLKLEDENARFLATAYYGRQNKGLGWVLSKNPKEKIDAFFFKRKMYQSIEKRMGLFNNPKTNCFRVFNGEGDGIGGMTIDYFNGYYLINWYSKGIYHFKDTIVKALSEIVEYDAIYEKCRFNDETVESTEDGFLLGKPADFPIKVKENGEAFAIYFNDGAMVGLFLDQREVRRSIRNNYARGKHVLNLFAYTGAFSVFAAQGSAKSTTSVDVANRTLERTKENFELNHIDSENNQIIIEDVFHFFKYADKKDLKYDMVILDPPSFAKSKDFTFSAERDYPDLLANAIDITKDDGIVVASNNSSNIDVEKFKQFVGKGFNLANARFELLEFHQLPRDFRTNIHYPESNYLKVAFLKVIRKKKIESFE